MARHPSHHRLLAKKPYPYVFITDELNRFYVRFDRDNKDPAIKAELPSDELPLRLSIADVLSPLSRENAH